MKIAGIYIIKNKLNNKIYVGKSINIKSRLQAHKFYLTSNKRNKKTTNRYLYASVQKNGWENFECEIIECFLNFDSQTCEKYSKDRELYWMHYYGSYEQDKGYNLRRDSSTNHFVHEETKKLISVLNKGINNPNYNNHWSDIQKEKMSKIAIERHKSGIYGNEWKKKLSKSSSKMWEDENKKKKMAEKVRVKKQKYKFLQFNKDNVLLYSYNSMLEVINKNPKFKQSCIYSVCNGYKKSHMGYIWKKELKI